MVFSVAPRSMSIPPVRVFVVRKISAADRAAPLRTVMLPKRV